DARALGGARPCHRPRGAARGGERPDQRRGSPLRRDGARRERRPAGDRHRLFGVPGDGAARARRDRRGGLRAVRHAPRRRRAPARLPRARRGERRGGGGAPAPRAGVRGVALRGRGAQAPRADLEAGALRRRHARVGGPDRAGWSGDGGRTRAGRAPYRSGSTAAGGDAAM
ncbi:MAG: hypothetical protein AVDCRST_MAG40-1570, partial [uncultured Gemmatimonadaceae bacterium]